MQKDQQAATADQLVPSVDSAAVPNKPGDQQVISEKVAKAYEFLKDEKPLKAAKNVRSELQGFREEGRMQAYGWSLPKRDSTKTSSSSSNLSVPVPVYCRPLFEQDNNLKLSCASTVDFNLSRLWQPHKFMSIQSFQINQRNYKRFKPSLQIVMHLDLQPQRQWHTCVHIGLESTKWHSLPIHNQKHQGLLHSNSAGREASWLAQWAFVNNQLERGRVEQESDG